LSSSYGTSTVSFTRVGLRVSTALFTRYLLDWALMREPAGDAGA
jgi:hypothetical protein